VNPARVRGQRPSVQVAPALPVRTAWQPAMFSGRLLGIRMMSNLLAVHPRHPLPGPHRPAPRVAGAAPSPPAGASCPPARWFSLSVGGDMPLPAPQPSTAEEVFRAYGPRVFSVALGMLANVADAEDVVQEVLLQVVRKLNTFRGEASLSTWLHRITVNAVLLHRRKQGTCKERQAQHPLDQYLGEGDAPARPGSRTPPQEALGRELRERIDQAIASLPRIYREVYVLGDLEGLSNAEICELLGLSLSAVKSRLHRGRQMMRSALAPYVEGVPA
jgi:RNA polymerase sigma-70 factor, ECF subfamily